MKYRATLSIGFACGKHEEIIDVDDADLADCETDKQREDLLNEHWQEWANGYIDGGMHKVEGGEE